ncbi:MAG: isoprenylcysteine carboxylmethyltransferase family protein [Blastocatellia bacterium]|nr:isoprenylcysteine carboxylmethyltransferase family protein [Blastocatellia bacterium]MCS7158452.1 isoprenylcysteine carboxylmethyltransferase family protein [Blastocatellia bacterium]MCX7753476.1 isoprenylcysteine carboxylmethyltransferase family protein [Blastocatellia bacterium]MDW8167867.1 isoprenylcysteine carboxylmethyltransferase family protein [Acidobacteriota bacterium]MDW8255901.1 isoprenylcysteine carboxylmethyltransferase family protein [Acidobacteriota bacterium]
MTPIFQFWFWTSLVACGVMELLVSRLPLGPRSQRDRHSLLWLGIVQAVGIPFVALTTASAPEIFCRLLFDGVGNVLGGIIAATGIFIRWRAKRTLGRFFTARVAILPEHRLVEHGPYRYVRHPGYLGILLFFLGWPLVVGHVLAIPLVWLPTLAVYLYRIKVEEDALREAFGALYRDYERRTARLLPFLW